MTSAHDRMVPDCDAGRETGRASEKAVDSEYGTQRRQNAGRLR